MLGRDWREIGRRLGGDWEEFGKRLGGNLEEFEKRLRGDWEGFGRRLGHLDLGKIFGGYWDTGIEHILIIPDDYWHRHRGDSSPCGQSPMDFESISLTARTQCLGCSFFEKVLSPVDLTKPGP